MATKKEQAHKEKIEEREVEERSSPGGHIIYKAVEKEGHDELERSNSGLAWSGLAAGLSMGFSLLSEGLLRSHLPDAPWRPLVAKFGYCIGFLVVVLGRQQLFTENTLTVILPLLRKRDLRTFGNVVRLWSIVLGANLVGAFLFALLVAKTNALDPGVLAAMKNLGYESMGHDVGTLILRGIFAGWLIALMVWLLPFAETARVWVIIIITYIVGVGGFSHVVAGSVDGFFLVASGAKTFAEYFSYMLPILLGNIIGGSSIVAAIAHAEHIASADNAI
ncbi:MAG TPA: formate/nitrite transporter family protein [Chthoniobacterales bacterium]|jgi:formate/nitrite transporter FocA (FNT family)